MRRWLTVLLCPLLTAVALGHCHRGAPYHNPNSGRFWTMDSYEGAASDPASLHKYNYCGNNPVNAYDPSGNTTLVEVNFAFAMQMSVRTLGGGLLGAEFGALAGGLDSIAHGNVSDQAIANAMRRGATEGLKAGLVFGAFGGIGGVVGGVGSLLTGALYLAPGFYGVLQDLEEGDYEGAEYSARMVAAGSLMEAAGAVKAVTKYYSRNYAISMISMAEATSQSDVALLKRKLIAERIGNGHAYWKHVVKKGEFPGIASPAQLVTEVQKILDNASEVKQLKGGRIGFWDAKTETVVIYDPNSSDLGTVFRPDATRYNPPRVYWDGYLQ